MCESHKEERAKDGPYSKVYQSWVSVLRKWLNTCIEWHESIYKIFRRRVKFRPHPDHQKGQLGYKNFLARKSIKTPCSRKLAYKNFLSHSLFLPVPLQKSTWHICKKHPGRVGMSLNTFYLTSKVISAMRTSWAFNPSILTFWHFCLFIQSILIQISLWRLSDIQTPCLASFLLSDMFISFFMTAWPKF